VWSLGQLEFKAGYSEIALFLAFFSLCIASEKSVVLCYKNAESPLFCQAVSGGQFTRPCRHPSQNKAFRFLIITSRELGSSFGDRIDEWE